MTKITFGLAMTKELYTLLNKMMKIRVGITIGDPAGIGPEITAKALKIIGHIAEFVVIGSRMKNLQFGKIKAEYGAASIEYLDKAMELIRAKQIDCLVTCPISKEAVRLAGFDYSGHTEYFAERTKTKDIVMMLLNRRLRFSLATRHIPVKEIWRVLNKESLSRTIEITASSLRKLFSIRQPRIVVCGLNPHASDNGTIGEEENRIIKPVIAALRKKIKYLDGPLAADTAVYQAGRKAYDCVIAIYHDQALIPLKLTSPQTGVNLTLGLPFIRTSPLHGTAFDIAGTGKAKPDSLITAIKTAIKCCVSQRSA